MKVYALKFRGNVLAIFESYSEAFQNLLIDQRNLKSLEGKLEIEEFELKKNGFHKTRASF